MNKKQKKILTRVIVSSAILIIVTLLPLEELPKSILYLIPYFIIGYDILIKAVKGVMNRQPFDENFLMAVATVGAIILGDFLEGTAVMLFYQIGELFQSYAVGKSRKSIGELMDIRPDYANLEGDNGDIITVDPDEVELGSIILVKPGEKIPIDGTVIEGESTLNTSALTGESLPHDVFVGDAVSSGSVNLTGLLKIQTTKEFGESTVSKILDLVENASSKKSRSEKFISRFARVYTPAVCFAALALAVLPPLVNLIIGNDINLGEWIYRALTFLVISCPCALVISVPLTFFAGIGGASKAGVLVKGSNYMETLADVSVVAFDKTGTVTEGVFEVAGIHHTSKNTEMLLEIAAHAESYSSHPISLSIQRAYGKPIDKSRVSDVREVGGKGIIARVDGKAVAAGNGKLMEELGITFRECHSVGTVVHIAVDGKYEGHILISDRIKPDAKEAVSALKNAGIKKTVMLTGDRLEAGNAVASELGIDKVYTDLLPTDKVSAVEELLASINGKKEKLAFVGDGINDAPVLSRADVGIAMGALGSDAAIEAADVVLMDDNPKKIAKAIRISRKCMRIVYQNIYFAIGVKLLCLLLGAVGVANMWIAIFADVGVMVIAVVNAIRAMNTSSL